MFRVLHLRWYQSSDEIHAIHQQLFPVHQLNIIPAQNTQEYISSKSPHTPALSTDRTYATYKIQLRIAKESVPSLLLRCISSTHLNFALTRRRSKVPSCFSSPVVLVKIFGTTENFLTCQAKNPLSGALTLASVSASQVE
jgi:hypothetical protein